MENVFLSSWCTLLYRNDTTFLSSWYVSFIGVIDPFLSSWAILLYRLDNVFLSSWYSLVYRCGGSFCIVKLNRVISCYIVVILITPPCRLDLPSHSLNLVSLPSIGILFYRPRHKNRRSYRQHFLENSRQSGFCQNFPETVLEGKSRNTMVQKERPKQFSDRENNSTEYAWNSRLTRMQPSE